MGMVFQQFNLFPHLTVLDNIMASLELQSQQMQYSSLMSPNYGGASSEVLEQKVHIEASFPNVSSHGEIEEALNNLKNSKIYRTDKDGSIMFKIKNNKLKIETCTP